MVYTPTKLPLNTKLKNHGHGFIISGVPIGDKLVFVSH